MKLHRRFLLNQLVGIVMIGAGFFFLTLPKSSVVGIGLLITFASLFISFGSILYYFQTTGHLRFFLLTMPFLILSSVYFHFGLLQNSSALIPAYFMLAFDVTLQYCHARQEEFRQWMNL